MRVFTHRITRWLAPDETPNNCWFKPQRGMFEFVDDLMDQFESLYPGVVPIETSPLDYTIILNPTMFIVGRYWGDESVLEIVQKFSDARNRDPGYQSISMKSTVITCDDFTHPTLFTLAELDNGHNILLESEYTIRGYYLASDPTTFVSVAQQV